jgi:formate dehydrogenase iron-sulfur subunit
MEKQNRRNFLKSAGLLTATIAGLPAKSAKAAPENILSEDRMGVLVDTVACIGCRNCEWACRVAHDLPAGELAEYENKSVFKQMRRPDSTALQLLINTKMKSRLMHL